jgi:hypothetical protein
MKYEFLDEKNLKKEPFKLKEGVDPATVDWQEELRKLTVICDGLQQMNEKLVKIFERNRARRNENK